MVDRIVGLTGATGVLGRRMAGHLAQAGWEMLPFRGDVRDRDAVETFVEQAELIVHAAAVVPVKRVEANLADAVHVNAAGTALLAAAAARLGRPFVFISTSHVYAATPGRLSEHAAVDPASLYGLTKLQGEQWVRALRGDHLILRLFSYFDEWQAEEYLVPSLRRRISEAGRGATIALAGAENIRDIASADWLADRCVRLISAGACGTINICSGQPRKIIDIAEALARETGRSDIIWHGEQDGPPNSLVGDPGLSDSIIGEAPAFDLSGALAQAYP